MASHEDLTKAKLQLELKLLSLQIKEKRKQLSKKTSRIKAVLSEWGPSLLTTITIISVTVGVYIKTHNYFEERRKANTFQITRSFLDLLDMLNSNDKRVQEMGYLSFSHFGRDALPYLLNHVEYTDRLKKVVWVVNYIKTNNDVDARRDIFEPLKLAANEISDKPSIDDPDIKRYRNILNAMASLSSGIEQPVRDFFQEQEKKLEGMISHRVEDDFVVAQILEEIKSIQERLR